MKQPLSFSTAAGEQSTVDESARWERFVWTARNLIWRHTTFT